MATSHHLPILPWSITILNPTIAYLLRLCVNLPHFFQSKRIDYCSTNKNITCLQSCYAHLFPCWRSFIMSLQLLSGISATALLSLPLPFEDIKWNRGCIRFKYLRHLRFHVKASGWSPWHTVLGITICFCAVIDLFSLLFSLYYLFLLQ